MFERVPILGDARTAPPQEDGPSASPPRTWSEVPWRTIVASVAVVVLTIAAIALMLAALRIIGWIVVAGFLAIVLSPAVGRLQARLGGNRILATSLVVFSTLAAAIGLIALFVLPVREQLVAIASDLPGAVDDAAAGRGPFGEIVETFGIADYVRDHEAELQDAVTGLQGAAFDLAKTVMAALFATVTITVMTFLFIAQSENLSRTSMSLLPARRRESVRRAGADAAAAISGYMIGNLIISLIAGVSTFIVLAALGVPNPVILALWVAVADLIPLVGATLGAVAGSFAAFLHSPSAGIAAIIFFVVYQQVENYVLYPSVMARRVSVNPLVVLLSVLVGVQLFGIMGALLAVPVSGGAQVALKAVRSERQRDQLILPDLVPDGAEPA